MKFIETDLQSLFYKLRVCSNVIPILQSESIVKLGLSSSASIFIFELSL